MDWAGLLSYPKQRLELKNLECSQEVSRASIGFLGVSSVLWVSVDVFFALFYLFIFCVGGLIGLDNVENLSIGLDNVEDLSASDNTEVSELE
jgi:hypothetical protein